MMNIDVEGLEHVKVNHGGGSLEKSVIICHHNLSSDIGYDGDSENNDFLDD